MRRATLALFVVLTLNACSSPTTTTESSSPSQSTFATATQSSVDAPSREAATPTRGAIESATILIDSLSASPEWENETVPGEPTRKLTNTAQKVCDLIKQGGDGTPGSGYRTAEAMAAQEYPWATANDNEALDTFMIAAVDAYCPGVLSQPR